MAIMEFLIDKSSSVPVIKQLQEQIKLSIAMGVLKRGDLLPSIRDVEQHTGINRGKIHRAFLALQKCGLLSPAPGKRIAIAVSAAAPDSMNNKCQELSRDIIKRIRKIGISPIAFARYLSQSMREEELKSPFIAYTDPDKELALRRAEQISRVWNVSVVGLSVDEFKLALAQGTKLQKVLVNHLTPDSIRRLPGKEKVEIIPLEVCYTQQTIRALEKLKAKSLLLLLPGHAIASARFIVEQLRNWMKCRDASVTWMDVRQVTDFGRLLKNSKYDRILVSPGARSTVPLELHHKPGLLLLQMELAPEGLEAARVRAGVIV
jgi:DNA-binding transcriptional regulator YhcF (GntR family)